MCAADDGVAAIAPKLANAGTGLLDVMCSGVLAFNAQPKIASTRRSGSQGIGQHWILLLELLNAVISIDINAAQASRDAPQGDADVTSPIQLEQILWVAHVGSGEVAPLDGGSLGAFAAGN